MSALRAARAVARPTAPRAAGAAVRALRLTTLALAILAAPAAHAQGTPRHTSDPWRTPRVVKWTLLAVSAGLGLWAYRESQQADDAYADLRRLCEREAGACTLSRGGYADARAEAHFQASNASDRRARIGLFAGQATLFGSAAFFIVDLRHDDAPENIPYDPPPVPAPAGARLRLGVRLGLP